MTETRTVARASGEGSPGQGSGSPPLQASETAHERVYQQLRQRILFGGFQPGRPVTLRGLAEEMAVSPMPVRDAVRRLTAEGALSMHGNRRVSVPDMSPAKFGEVVFARMALEPELAARALDRFSAADVEALKGIDAAIDAAMARDDAEGYMRNNYRFHYCLYEKAEAPTLLALVASIWLQFGPFMRLVYGRFGTARLQDQHQVALEAIAERNAGLLRLAIAEDIRQGMRFIGEAALAEVPASQDVGD